MMNFWISLARFFNRVFLYLRLLKQERVYRVLILKNGDILKQETISISPRAGRGAVRCPDPFQTPSGGLLLGTLYPGMGRTIKLKKSLKTAMKIKNQLLPEGTCNGDVMGGHAGPRQSLRAILFERDKMGWLKDCEICNAGLCKRMDELTQGGKGLSEREAAKVMEAEAAASIGEKVWNAEQIRHRYLYHSGKRSGAKRTRDVEEESAATCEEFYFILAQLNTDYYQFTPVGLRMLREPNIEEIDEYAFWIDRLGGWVDRRKTASPEAAG